MIDQRLARWLASDDTGTSSMNIMLWLAAKVKPAGWASNSPPSDPSDLGRCLRLLAIMPEWEGRISEMAELGGMWPTYVKHWDALAYSMANEVGIDWSKGKKAPRTYVLMKKVQDEAYAARTDGVKTVKLGSGTSVSFLA